MPERGPGAFKYKKGTFKNRWAKPTEGEVFLIPSWGDSITIPIKSINEDDRVITLTRGRKDFDRAPYFLKTPFELVQVRCPSSTATNYTNFTIADEDMTTTKHP